MDYKLFQVSAVKAFGHCRDIEAMVSDMQQVLSAVPGMVRKNERLEKEKADLKQENAALKAELDDWKGNAEGFEPDAYMRLPVDSDGVPIRIGDEMNIDGDAMTVLGYRLHDDMLLLIAEDKKSGLVFTPEPSRVSHFKPEPADSWEKLLGDLDRARNEGHGDGECLYADCASGNCGDCRFDSRQLEPQDCCIDHIFGDIARRIRALREVR